MFSQVANNPRGLARTIDLDADEDMRFARIGDAVVELGDVAAAEGGAELLEAAGALRDGDREHRLAMLAELGLLGDEAQPVEVGVRARGDRDQRLAARPMAFDPGLFA